MRIRKALVLEALELIGIVSGMFGVCYVLAAFLSSPMGA